LSDDVGSAISYQILISFHAELLKYPLGRD